MAGLTLTTSTIAVLQDISPRRVQQLIFDLGIIPKKIGNTFVLTNAQYKRIAKRNRKPGRRNGRNK